MTSKITNYTVNIDPNYPVAGQDNDTEGFRSNFSNILQGLNQASDEITSLQQYTFKKNETNDLKYDGLLKSPVFQSPGEFVSTNIAITQEVNTYTGINYLEGNYKQITVGTTATLAITNWPKSGIKGTMMLELVNEGLYDFEFPVTIINPVTGGVIKKNKDLTFPVKVSTSSNESTVLELWTVDGGSTVFVEKKADTGSNLVPYYWNIYNTSTQPNIQSLELDYVTIGGAKLDEVNNRLIITGVTGIAIDTTATIDKTLLGWQDPNPGDSLHDHLLLDSVTDLEVGTTFSFLSTSSEVFVITSINPLTNIVGLNRGANAYSFETQGVTTGSTVLKFHVAAASNASFFAPVKPSSRLGKSTDRKGKLFGNQNELYVCHSDWTGSSPAWSVIQTITGPLTTSTPVTTSFTYDVSTSTNFFHKSATGHFAANFTNVPTSAGQTNATITVKQGATPYQITTATTINGSNFNIKWPSGYSAVLNANALSVYTFKILNDGEGAFYILGDRKDHV